MVLISPIIVAINSHWHPDHQDSPNLQPLPLFTYIAILAPQQVYINITNTLVFNNLT